MKNTLLCLSIIALILVTYLTPSMNLVYSTNSRLDNYLNITKKFNEPIQYAYLVKYFDHDGDKIADNIVLSKNKTYDLIITLSGIPWYLLKKLETLGIQINSIYKHVIKGIHVRNLTLGQLNILKRILHNYIILIENNSMRTLLMDRATKIVGIRSYLWPILSNISVPVTVAIVDTGVDATHKDLANKVIFWKDLTGESNEPLDPHGHGTMIASIIAGDGSASINGTTWITLYGTIHNSAVQIFSLNIPFDQQITLNVSWTSEYAYNECELFIQFINEENQILQTLNISSFRFQHKIFLPRGDYKILAWTTGIPATYQIRIKVNRTRDQYPPMRGVNPNLNLAVFKVFRSGEIATQDSIILEALDLILELSDTLDIVAINLSLGGYTPSLSLDSAINELAKHGIVTVVAAGNSYIALSAENINTRQIGSPGTAAYAITVGGTNDYYGIAIYSSRGGSYTNGPNLPYVKPDLVAPSGGLVYGSWIVAADSNNPDGNFSDYENDYTGAIGTSFSTPIITGIAASVIALLIQKGEWSNDLSSVLFVKFLLLVSTFETTYIGLHETRFKTQNDTILRDPPPLSFGKKDYDEGFGIIHLPAILYALSHRLNVSNKITLFLNTPNLLSDNISNDLLVYVLPTYLDGCYRIRVEYNGSSDYYLCVYKAMSWDGSPIFIDYLYKNRVETTLRGAGFYVISLKPKKKGDSGTIKIIIEKLSCINHLVIIFSVGLLTTTVLIIILDIIKRSHLKKSSKESRKYFNISISRYRIFKTPEV